MATIEPLQALHYDLGKTGGLQPVVSAPYDVIDAERRRALSAQSPYNVVEIDLPQAADGQDPYAQAAETLRLWQGAGVVVADSKPAIWPLTQEYTVPDGGRRTRCGFLTRVRIEDYGAGRVRPHERTHPGPRADRLALTRATRVNLSPIFSLYSDPRAQAWTALAAKLDPDAPWATTEDPDGTVNRLWRVTDLEAIEQVRQAAGDAELLIADGHHRYETARVYAEEVGGEGPHRYVLMCLVALEDPGLTVLATHRLLHGLDERQWRDLDAALVTHFERHELAGVAELAPSAADTAGDTVTIGYLDRRSATPCRLVLRDRAAADAAMPACSEPYRRLDTAVTEALILKGALGMSDEQIDQLDGLRYARDRDQAIAAVGSGECDAALFMAPTSIAQVQAVAAAGESMPPKSTYFFPKVPTGLLFSPLA